MGLPDLPGYLRARGRRPPGADARSQADAALQAFVTAMWADATDFAFDAPALRRRVRRARGRRLRRLRALARRHAGRRPRDRVRGGGARRRAHARARRRAARRAARAARRRVRHGRRARARAGRGEGPSLEQAGRRLRRLQTALRLWDDAEPALGPTAWARTDGAPWLAIPLATGLRRTTGDCLLAPEEEDPLRAFCSLVARRTPRSGELAWALRRFELGCERGTPLEALTDWLLSARALLAEPDAVGYERLCERMAAICATPGRARRAGRRAAPGDRDGARGRGGARAPRAGGRGARHVARRVPARDPARRALRAPRSGPAAGRRRAARRRRAGAAARASRRFSRRTPLDTPAPIGGFKAPVDRRRSTWTAPTRIVHDDRSIQAGTMECDRQRSDERFRPRSTPEQRRFSPIDASARSLAARARRRAGWRAGCAASPRRAAGCAVLEARGAARAAVARGVQEIPLAGDPRHARAEPRVAVRRRVPPDGRRRARAGSGCGSPSTAGARCRRSRSCPVGDGYAVRDGHHRVSVARARGALTIDALVTAP